MEDQLVDFFRSRKQQAASPELDWQAKKDTWVRSVVSLYAIMQEMLRDSIASNDVTVRTFATQVSEDFRSGLASEEGYLGPLSCEPVRDHAGDAPRFHSVERCYGPHLRDAGIRGFHRCILHPSSRLEERSGGYACRSR